MIFTSDQGLELLSNSKHRFCDGTVKVCPETFHQVCTIQALVNKLVLPYLFPILPNKNQQTYQLFSRGISNPVRGIPLCTLFDFQRAAINKIQLLLPHVEIKGCFFHYHQIFGDVFSPLDSKKCKEILHLKKNMHLICECWLS